MFLHSWVTDYEQDQNAGNRRTTKMWITRKLSSHIDLHTHAKIVFDLLTSGSIHADALSWTIWLPILMFIAQVVDTHRSIHPHTQTKVTDRPTHKSATTSASTKIIHTATYTYSLYQYVDILISDYQQCINSLIMSTAMVMKNITCVNPDVILILQSAHRKHYVAIFALNLQNKAMAGA